jgi:hypothetical protein
MPLCVARCADPRSLVALVALLLAGEAFAQTDNRDALIDELHRRIEVLEKRLEEKPPAPPVAAPAVPKPAPKPAASEEAGRQDEGARALERTLARTGGLVLPKGAFELEPRLEYAYRGFEGLRIVTAGGISQIAPQDISRTEIEASLALRVGLPWSMQVEIRVPYVWAYEDRATFGASRQSEHVSGLGDIEVALAKQFLDERRGRPALLGSLSWKSTTGDHELGRLSPGSGFPQLQAALTAVLRQDPLVFLGTVSYAYVGERERSGTDVDPGDAIGIKVGALLAASPETSLRAAFDFTRSGRARVGDTPPVAGSDATVGILEIGLATLLTAKTLLDVELGIGVTPDAPDFRVRLALPIRF